MAFRASGGKLCPDMGCGCQIPKNQSSGQTPSDQALLFGERLIGKDTVLMVLKVQLSPMGLVPGLQSTLIPHPEVAITTHVHMVELLVVMAQTFLL